MFNIKILHLPVILGEHLINIGKTYDWTFKMNFAGTPLYILVRFSQWNKLNKLHLKFFGKRQDHGLNLIALIQIVFG